MNMTQKIEFLRLTQKIDFFMIERSECCFQRKLTQSIEPSFFQDNSQNWNSVQYDSTLLKNITQRIEPFWKIWRKELIFFSIWLKTMNLLFNMTQKNEYELITELNSFFGQMSQRIENMSHRIFSSSEKYDSQNWTFFWHDSPNWILLFNMTHRIEPIFWIRLKELNTVFYDSMNWTFFFFDDSKNWTFLFPIWLKELNLFDKKNSQNWTPPALWTRLTDFFEVLTEFWKNDSKNFFFWNDSKNWTFSTNSRNWTLLFNMT